MKYICLMMLFFVPAIAVSQTANTLETLDSDPPQTHAEMWAGFDPTAEPLDVEILKEWEEDDVVLKVLRFRVGTFKGTPAMVAAVYGYPKSGTKLPGLVNIHGGGQFADYKAPLTNAKRGYATITIAWAGRVSSPQYRVSRNEVKLFWDQETDNPKYKVTTDWGALDGYHAPSKNGKDAFKTIRDGKQDWTLDNVKSPRNCSWFLCTMAARRALTFLQQQPEVDAEKLGVYGHSMGGKLTVLTAGSDDRVKAAAPSCGGISDRYNQDPLHGNTVGDSPSLKNITCPTVFLSPANDFHGHINDLVPATKEIKSQQWRVTCSPHLNHKDLPAYEVATQLWFDEHLKGSFKFPETPRTKIELKTASGVPAVAVKPDDSMKILAVDVYYTQQGQLGGDNSLSDNRKNRFWHHAKAAKKAGYWQANTPVFNDDRPLWIYANVRYALDEPVSGAGYYYSPYSTDEFNVSSVIEIFSAEQVQQSGVAATLKKSLVIEDFQGDWMGQWFVNQPGDWRIRTHKIYHPMWSAPAGGKLVFDIRSDQKNTLVVGIDEFGTTVEVTGDQQWQTVSLTATEFTDADEQQLENWDEVKELRFSDTERLKARRGSKTGRRLIGTRWTGSDPEFRNLRWVESE